MSTTEKPNINIELNEEIAEGTYANLVLISHSPEEFVFDFIRMMPGVPKAKVKSRIVMTPQHAKRFLRALEDNIRKYESNYDKIKENRDANTFSFNVQGGEA